jgi:hypothetical protein
MLQTINHLAIHPEEFYLLGYNTMLSIESQLMFPSVLKNKPSKRPT